PSLYRTGAGDRGCTATAAGERGAGLVKEGRGTGGWLCREQERGTPNFAQRRSCSVLPNTMFSHLVRRHKWGLSGEHDTRNIALRLAARGRFGVNPRGVKGCVWAAARAGRH